MATGRVVAMDGVIGAAVVIITVGAEAAAITMAGGTITSGKRHQCPKIGVSDLRLNTECQFQFINHAAPPWDMDLLQNSPKPRSVWTQQELARLTLLARERATAAKAAKALGAALARWVAKLANRAITLQELCRNSPHTAVQGARRGFLQWKMTGMF